MTDALDAERAGILLSESVTSTFADMAFIDVRRVAVETDGRNAIQTGTPVPDNERCVAIDVLMPLSCSIELSMSVATRDRIVDTLFAPEPGNAQRKMADDSLLEILNVVAGSFLSAYFGAGAPIQLELPRLLFLARAPVGQTVARVLMDAEGAPLTVTLTSVRYRY